MQLMTPAGVAGVACVRVEPHERDAALACLRTRRGAAVLPAAGGAPLRAELWLDERAVDDVLVVDRGAAGLELHVHGAPAVLELLARRFALRVAGPSSPAAALLRNALGPAQLDLALEQLEPGFQPFVASLRALPDAERRTAARAALARSRVAMALATAHRLVLVGAQNAGKSSLFNTLLFRERVLTGELAGLTRDPVAEVTTLDGYPYELIDTAGLGPFASDLDARAFAAGQARRRAATVLLVVDGHRGVSTADRELLAAGGGAVLVLANKCDLPQAPWPTVVPRHLDLSATAEPSAALRTRLGALLRAQRELPGAGPVGGPAALCDDELWLLGELAGEGAPPARL